MPKETETYRDTLVRLAEKGKELGFKGELLNVTQVADLLGQCRRTVHTHRARYGFYQGHTTYAKVARGISQQGKGR